LAITQNKATRSPTGLQFLMSLGTVKCTE